MMHVKYNKAPLLAYAPENKETINDMISLITGERACLSNLSAARVFWVFRISVFATDVQTKNFFKEFALQNPTLFPEGMAAYFVYIRGQEICIGYYCLVQKGDTMAGKNEIVVINANVHRSSDAACADDPHMRPFHFITPAFN